MGCHSISIFLSTINTRWQIICSVGNRTETYCQATIPALTPQNKLFLDYIESGFSPSEKPSKCMDFFNNKHYRGELTCVSEASRTDVPVFSYSCTEFFSSVFSALNYKYNNNITALFQNPLCHSCFCIFNMFMTETKGWTLSQMTAILVSYIWENFCGIFYKCTHQKVTM